MIDTGTAAPEFTLPDDNGDSVSLLALRPHIIVLYFYPRDDTSGCTTEALDFTENLSAFDAAGALVLGVSKDPVKKHGKFKEKHALGITLLSDAESDVCERYGVFKEKQMYGKTFMGIERSTFLIDGNGIVRSVWRKVRVPGHVRDVLTAAREI